MGELVECKVVGGRSCAEAVVSFEFYCVGWCAQPVSGHPHPLVGLVLTYRMLEGVLVREDTIIDWNDVHVVGSFGGNVCDGGGPHLRCCIYPVW